MLSKISRIIFSVSIISTVLFFTGGNLVALFGSYLQDDQSIIAITRDQFCIPKIRTPTDLTGKKLVVLRLDDVQAYSWRGITIQMIQDAQRYNAAIVAGVIPKNLTEDHVLIRFLQRENCNIEIAMHGWDHYGTGIEGLQSQYITEFGNVTYIEARHRIEMARQVLEPISNKPITTFIPPFNIASPATVRAVSDAGIQVLSSIGTGIYDYHSTTYNFDQKRTSPVGKILANCDDSFSKNEPCVIMLHPQDYANPEKNIDEELYNAHYLAMLKYFSDMGAVFVTFDDLIKNGSSDP